MPDAKVVFIVNDELKKEIIDCMETAGAHFGVKVVRLGKVDKQEGHPTVKGMTEISEELAAALL